MVIFKCWYNIGNIGLFEIEMIHFELPRVFEIENNYVKNNYVYIYVKQLLLFSALIFGNMELFKVIGIWNNELIRLF